MIVNIEFHSRGHHYPAVFTVKPFYLLFLLRVKLAIFGSIIRSFQDGCYVIRQIPPSLDSTVRSARVIADYLYLTGISG